MAACHALVVDDDPEGRDALAHILERHGYVVRQAENGRVALDRIAELRPCLMLLDLEMPVMNGWEVLAFVRTDLPCAAMAVVVVSAAASPPPDVTFLRKPCDVDHLLEAVPRAAPRAEGRAHRRCACSSS
jgi:CheY-like chemotaxis protein